MQTERHYYHTRGPIPPINWFGLIFHDASGARSKASETYTAIKIYGGPKSSKQPTSSGTAGPTAPRELACLNEQVAYETLAASQPNNGTLGV